MPEEKSKVPVSFKAFTAIVKEVGVPGFLAIVFAFLLIVCSTTEQKREFIDIFFLLKNKTSAPYCFTIITIFLVTLIILEGIYFSKMQKLKDNEIHRLSEIRNKLEEELLNRKLRSSK